MLLRTKLTIAFVSAAVVRLGFHIASRFVADDAFITFRYAENLASGYGFVYNTGERVLGSSTPLFTWLLSLPATVGISPVTAAVVISLICSGSTSVLIYRLALNLRMGRLAWLPVIAYTFWPRSIPAETCGLETALFTLLVIAAFYYAHRRFGYYAIGLATLATLTRPEGGLLLVLVLIQTIRRDPRRWLSQIGVAAILLVPWLAFAQLYFGSIVPHSITAKLALYSQFGTSPWWYNLVYLMAWHNPVGWCLTALAVPGGYWLNRTQNYGRIEIAWLIGMIAFYTFGQTHLFFWYVAPIYPILLLIGSAAVCLMFDRFPTFNRDSRWIVVALGATITLVLSIGVGRAYTHYGERQDYFDRVLKPAGFFLKQQTAEGDLIAAEDIGYLGYHSEGRILDRDGLVSPVAVPYNREGRYFELIRDTRPDWVAVTVGSPISAFINSPEFLSEYVLSEQFGRNDETEYLVYRRK